MLRVRLRGALAAFLLLAGIGLAPAGCGLGQGAALSATPATTSPPAPPEPVSLRVDRQRGTPAPVLSGGPAAPYNYGPSVLADGGRYRAWWCSQLPNAGPPGDDILSADAPAPSGPYGIGTPVYSGSGGGFDASHSCDPSVIRANGGYFLYYTGSPMENHAQSNSIGVATSADGVHWTRQAAGSIVGPAGDVLRDNRYGAGQPAAVYLDGWFYLMFTDTTARAAGWNGAGQFVLRSPDPLFGGGVEALAEHGFAPVATTHAPRTRSVLDAFSADLMWVDALNAFAIAHEVDGGTQITFRDRDFITEPYRPVLVTGPWAEGPGLVRRSDGHAPVSPDDPCGRVPIDLLRATRNPVAPTDIAWFGIDLVGAAGCPDPARAAAVLAGVGVPDPDRTIDVIVEGRRLRVERRSVAAALAGRILDHPIPIVDRLPLLTVLPAGTPAVVAPDRPVGLVLDGLLWPLPNAAVAVADSAPTGQLGTAEWDAYRKGVDLRLLP